MKIYVNVAFMVLLLLVVLSVVYSGVVAYNIGYLDGKSRTRERAVVKTAVDYEIYKHYFAERLQWEPSDWNTTEELGVVFIKNRSFDLYDVYIFDEEKALPWMEEIPLASKTVKYEEEFYRISFLWVDFGLSYSFMRWAIPLGILLGAGWILTGILFLKKGRKNENV